MYNPCIRGWISYYSHFHKTQLRPTLKRIDAYVIRWARRKFKRLRHQTKGARDWFHRRGRAKPTLFALGLQRSDSWSASVQVLRRNVVKSSVASWTSVLIQV
jgi:hypothetical protein